VYVSLALFPFENLIRIQRPGAGGRVMEYRELIFSLCIGLFSFFFVPGLRVALPGATFDHIQTVDHLQDDDPPITDGPPRQRDHISTTLVFFLGGCTFAEISALRKMRKASKGSPRSLARLQPQST
jgi:hypothetical protein